MPRVLSCQTLPSSVKLSSRTHQARRCIWSSNYWPQMGQRHKRSHTLDSTVAHLLPDLFKSAGPPAPGALQRSRRQSPLCLKWSRYLPVLSHRGRFWPLGRWDYGGRALAQVVSPKVLYPIVGLAFLSPKVSKLVHNVSLLRLTDVS
jgi:hypothetical protein